MTGERQIAERLRDQGLITEAQFRTAIEYQASTGGSLTDILVKLGFVKDEVMHRALAEEQGIEMIDITRESIDHGAMAKIPRAVVERHQVVPIQQDAEKGTILLAMSDASNLEAVQEVQFLTNCRVETVLAPRSALVRAINQYYNLITDDGKPVSVEDILQMLMGKTPEAIVASMLMALARKGFITLSEFRDELERLG